MNQQETNFEILANSGIVQISESLMLNEYIVFGHVYSDSTISSESEQKINYEVV